MGIESEMNQKMATKLIISKITKLKTKTKKEELIVFEGTTGIISAFEFLHGYVKNDSVIHGLIIYSTEFGYQLLDDDGSIKFEYIIEEI